MIQLLPSFASRTYNDIIVWLIELSCSTRELKFVEPLRLEPQGADRRLHAGRTSALSRSGPAVARRTHLVRQGSRNLFPTGIAMVDRPNDLIARLSQQGGLSFFLR